MPPKQLFTREVIEEAAYGVVRELGFSQLTARAVAERLNSSTMPIYSYLKSMDDIAAAVRIKATVLLAEYQTRTVSENPFLDMAVGYVTFAQKEKHLFRFLYFDMPKTLTEEEQKEINHRIESELGRKLPFNQIFGSIDQSSMNALALKSWFFTHGMAVALMSGAVEAMNEERIRELLTEAGSAFYFWEKEHPK